MPIFLPFSHSISLYFPVTLLLQMSSEILWRAVLLLLVDCATILWFFLYHFKKQRRPRKKIFICADCWLAVFDFLAPSQLGLEIGLISRRFDLRVDEHFKTRKWRMDKQLLIQWEIEENGTKKMQIVKSDGKPLPIPRNPLPNKMLGFRSIQIIYIDQNVVAFLRHFHRLLGVCGIFLDIFTGTDRIWDYFLLNIWPMLRDSMHLMLLNSNFFRRLRQLDPSMLSNCPSLRYVSLNVDFVPAFPPDDSAMASDGQAVAKWLFTPRPDGVPKWIACRVNPSLVDQWSSTMEQLKEAFSNASSPVTFRIYLKYSSTLMGSVVPFYLFNEVTGEQLSLAPDSINYVLLTRCPIEWDERNWQNVLHELLTPPNPIHFLIRDGGFDEGLLDDASPEPSGQQQ